MGIQHSSEIKYMLTNINGNSVSIPYIRLSNGQWVPFQQHNQNWYHQSWNTQRALPGAYISPTIVPNRSLYPIANQIDYYMPNQAYYGGTFFR